MATASQVYENKRLREKRGEIRAKIEALGTKLKTENRAMTPEEQTSFDALKTDFAGVSDSVRKSEADIAALDSLLSQDHGSDGGGANPPAAPAAAPAPQGNSDRQPGREDRSHIPHIADIHAQVNDLRLARSAWFRRNMGKPATREQAEAVKRIGFDMNAPHLDLRLGSPATRRERMQQRALTVTTSAGGYLIAQDYSHELEQKLVAYSAVRGVCREVQTSNGADLPWPTEDDTGNTGELLAINTEVAYADPTFASVTFKAFKFSSKGVIVPHELIEDADFDVASLVFGEIGVRLGRIGGSYFTTGAGTTEPKGVVTCAAAGLTTANATSFTADELTRLMVAVDPAYLSGGSVGYMMKHDTLAYALLLKDSNGRPLVRESYAQGMGVTGMDGEQAGRASGMTINGFPVFLNQFMVGLTSNLPVTATKHVLFGNFDKFIVRDAGSVRIYRLDERLREKDQTLFVGFIRSDSNCVNTAAIKYLLQA